MKNTLIKQALLASVLLGSAKAATVTLAFGLAGTSVQGIRLSNSLDNSTWYDSSDYYVGVGRYDEEA